MIKKFNGMFLILVLIVSFFSDWSNAQETLSISGINVIPLQGGGCEIKSGATAGNNIVNYISGMSIDPSKLYTLPSDGSLRREALQKICEDTTGNLNKLFNNNGFSGNIQEQGKIVFKNNNFESVINVNGLEDADFGSLGKFDGEVDIANLDSKSGTFNIKSGSYAPSNKFVDGLGQGNWEVINNGQSSTINGKGGIDLNGDNKGWIGVDKINAELSNQGKVLKITELKSYDNQPLDMVINRRTLHLDKGMNINNFNFDKDSGILIDDNNVFGNVKGNGIFKYDNLEFNVHGDSQIGKHILSDQKNFLYEITNADKTNPDGITFLTKDKLVDKIYIDNVRGRAVGLPEKDILVEKGIFKEIIKVEKIDGKFYDVVGEVHPKGNAISLIEREQQGIRLEYTEHMKDITFNDIPVVDADGNRIAHPTVDDLLNSDLGEVVEIKTQPAARGLAEKTVTEGFRITEEGHIENFRKTVDFDLTKKGLATIGVGTLAVGGVIAGVAAFSKHKKK